jgi:hypothetical protein
MSLKAQARRADTTLVHAGPPLSTALDDVLGDLPGSFVVAADGDARLVIGPAGAFVLLPLVPPSGYPTAFDEAAHRVRALAARTRSGLSDHLGLVPFLDPLLVSTGPLVRGLHVTVAPVDLLADVLTGGPARIDDPTLAAVGDVVRRRGLGRWRAAPDGPDGPATGYEPPGPLGLRADGRIAWCQSHLTFRTGSTG